MGNAPNVGPAGEACLSTARALGCRQDTSTRGWYPRSSGIGEEEGLGDGLTGFDRQMCLRCLGPSEKVWPTRGASRPAPTSARTAVSSRGRSPSPYWRSAMVVTVTPRRSDSPGSIRCERAARGAVGREPSTVGNAARRLLRRSCPRCRRARRSVDARRWRRGPHRSSPARRSRRAATAPAADTTSRFVDPRAAPTTFTPRAASSWTRSIPMPPAAREDERPFPLLRARSSPGRAAPWCRRGGRPWRRGGRRRRALGRSPGGRPLPVRRSHRCTVPPVCATTGRPRQLASTPSPTAATVPPTPLPGT